MDDNTDYSSYLSEFGREIVTRTLKRNVGPTKRRIALKRRNLVVDFDLHPAYLQGVKEDDRTDGVTFNCVRARSTSPVKEKT